MKIDQITRREQIMQAVVEMLHKDPGARITTAKLAKTVGVTEAALYRHFPSKAKVLEALIDHISDRILPSVRTICAEDVCALERLERSARFVLKFAKENPGICAVLTGEALSGEGKELRERVSDFYLQLQFCISGVLVELARSNDVTARLSAQSAAHLLTTIVEGRICSFSRCGFVLSPLADWGDHWLFLMEQFFILKPRAAA